jgi:hypothetical protein
MDSAAAGPSGEGSQCDAEARSTDQGEEGKDAKHGILMRGRMGVFDIVMKCNGPRVVAPRLVDAKPLCALLGGGSTISTTTVKCLKMAHLRVSVKIGAR